MITNYAKFRAGVDYYIKEINAIIHQPSYKEIADVLSGGERQLYVFMNLVTITVQDAIDNKILNENLTETQIAELTDFSILLLLLSDKTNNRDFKEMLSLLFPSADKIEINLDEEVIMIYYSLNNVDLEGKIDKYNFAVFVEHLRVIFPILKNVKGQYLTKGKLANEIKEKILKGRQKVAEAKKTSDNENIDIFGRYCVILSIGKTFRYEELIGMTIFNLTKLYEAYMHERMYLSYREQALAGVKDVEPVKDWICYTDLNIEEE